MPIASSYRISIDNFQARSIYRQSRDFATAYKQTCQGSDWMSASKGYHRLEDRFISILEAGFARCVELEEVKR